MNERQREILELLGEDEAISVSALSNRFGVSGVTIRGDLDHLENQGLLKRVHGGAILHHEDDISRRIGINYARKLSIARRAAAYVSRGETIFIEAGSANALLARQLSPESGIQVVTSNVFITRQLKDSGVDVILLGGVYQHDSECVVGSLAKLGLESLHFSKAFIGADGINPSEGFTCTDMMRAEIAREAVRKATHSFVVSDSTKFGKVALSPICALEEITYVVTDSDIPPDQRRALEGAGVRVDVDDAPNRDA